MIDLQYKRNVNSFEVDLACKVSQQFWSWSSG